MSLQTFEQNFVVRLAEEDEEYHVEDVWSISELNQRGGALARLLDDIRLGERSLEGHKVIDLLFTLHAFDDSRTTATATTTLKTQTIRKQWTLFVLFCFVINFNSIKLVTH